MDAHTAPNSLRKQSRNADASKLGCTLTLQRFSIIGFPRPTKWGEGQRRARERTQPALLLVGFSSLFGLSSDQKTRFEDVVRGVDVVFDGLGADTLDRAWGVLVKGGKLVTVASQSAENADQRVLDAFMLVQADG